MAKKLNDRPFRPSIPDDIPSGAKIRLLCDALSQIYEELNFHLFALGAENFRQGGIRSLGAELGVPVLWSAIEGGAEVPEGTLAVFEGGIYRCLGKAAFDPDEDPENSLDWEKAT